MNEKFELIKNDSIEIDGHKLYRLRALINFNDVKAGDLGGYVENENNLSQMDDCWIYDDACVSGNARIFSNAYVCDNAYVSDDARVFGNACISGNASINDNAYVCDNACISGNASIDDNACISGNARVYGSASVYGDACIYDNARVYDNAHISGNAIIKRNNDYIVFKNSWSSGRYFTYTKSNKMWKVGCFYGSGDELIQKAYADSENSGKHYELYVNLVKEMEKLDNEND